MSRSRWWMRALARAAPEHRRDEVLGDLEEMWRRRAGKDGPVRATVTGVAEGVGVALTFVVQRARTRAAAALLAPAEWRLALRWVRKSPLLSATVVLALTAGVTLAATGFTLTTAFLDQELPFAAGDRVVDISVHDERTGERVALPPRLVRAWAAADVRLERIGVVSSADLNLTHGAGEVELVRGIRLTAEAFDYVPFDPIRGRFLSAADARIGAPRVVVIGEGLWKSRFGADPSIVGEAVELGGVDHVVVGIVPDVGFPAPASLYLPLALDRLDQAGWVASGRLVGLLPPGGTATSAQAALLAAADVAEEAAPVVARVRRAEDPPAGGGAGALVVALLVGLLAVIAGNVGNLMVARAYARRDELTVRAALGADRLRLTAQLTAEALVLTLVAAVAGTAISQRLLSAFARSEGEIPPWIDLGLDAGTVLFVVLVTLLVTGMAGVAPALRATRVRGAALRSAGGAVAGVGFGWMHHAMIVTQIALAVGVVGASASLQRGWSGGFDPAEFGGAADRTFVVQVALPDARPELGSAMRLAVEDLPEVRAAALANHTPGIDAPTARVVVDGGAPNAGQPTVARVARVGAGFFDVLQAGASSGRLFTEADLAPGAPRVALVNEPFVRDRLGGANALGRRVALAAAGDGPVEWAEVVGVVPDLGLSGTDPSRAAGIYLPLGTPSRFDLLVRTDAAHPTFEQRVRSAAFDTDPTIAVESVWVLSALIERVRWIFFGVGSTVAAVGGIVLGLSLLGIYALLAFEVSRRTREIGIRIALGARPADVVRPVLRRVATYAGVGGLLGTILGLALGRVAQGMVLLPLPETGLGTLGAIVGAVLAAGLVAAAVPTLRTLAIEPSTALRSE